MESGLTFPATLHLAGKTATGIEVPSEIVTALDAGRRPPVVVTIGKHSYRSTIASMGGSFWIPVSALERDAAGIAAGDTLEVSVVLDTEPRTIALPDDLAAAIGDDATARDFFAALPPSHQKAYVTWLDGAKKPETRSRRVIEAAAMLHEGKRR